LVPTPVSVLVPCDHAACLVEDRDASGELPDDGVLAVDGDGGGQQEVPGDHSEELTLE
jgi:hypothetical protein